MCRETCFTCKRKVKLWKAYFSHKSIIQEIFAALESTVDKIERQNHFNNLVLDEVPFTSGENLYHIVHSIADNIYVNFNEYDINS